MCGTLYVSNSYDSLVLLYCLGGPTSIFAGTTVRIQRGIFLLITLTLVLGSPALCLLALECALLTCLRSDVCAVQKDSVAKLNFETLH
jgi:hypothetical protein